MNDVFMNRELSWLKFNERVLEEAEDERTPLCERLSFASIYQSNLDEFFMVRVGSLVDQDDVTPKLRENKTNMTAREQIDAVIDRVRELNGRRDKVYARLMEKLEEQGVRLVDFRKIGRQESERLERYFDSEIAPLISPSIVGRRQPFPFLRNKDIYAVVVLEGKKGKYKLGIIPCSAGVFPRLIEVSASEKTYMLAEDLILHFIPKVFEGYVVKAKSLMRVMESVDHIARQMAADGEESAPLSEYAQMGYVSGLIVMDETGFVLSDYHGTGEAPRQLGEYLDSPALLDAALYPEKRYATRFACADGSMIDLAAVGRRDAPGIVAAYYRTPVEYLDAFRLSIALMLSGYSPETSGTIVVTGGSRVVASNDETLIGGNAGEMAILRQIRQAYSSGELVRASWPEDSFRRYYGMMGCGRNFYVYVYMPEKTVFATTPQSMLFALIFYAVVLAFAKAVRFRTAQSYQERQYRVQKEYAEKLRAANAELSAAVDQADRANAATTSFLSRMSHDIRTPLNGIIGLLQIDDAHPSDVALLTANREKMKVAANHLLSLINDVLQMSKLESGEITLAHEPLDLNRLLRDILTIVEQRAAEAGVALEYDRRQFERMKPDCVYGSPLHLRQVFLNVYGNCIKYNKVGGSVTTLCRNVGERDGIVTYRWVIRDTGIGMSRAFLAHIFDPFAQEHTDARSVYHGTGLGMAIVKSLIDKMGGSIEVSSREGEGSEFVITLPFEIAEELPEPQQAAWETETADVRGLRILLAEDNELNIEIAVFVLENAGVFKQDAAGQQAFVRFMYSVGFKAAD